MQEKFYKAIKDKREPHWKQLYEDLRAKHDGIVAPRAGTAEDPIETSGEDTFVQPIENSSQTLSETTIAEDDAVKNSQSTLRDTPDGVKTAAEDTKTIV